jgi:hypothetical protein
MAKLETATHAFATFPLRCGRTIFESCCHHWFYAACQSLAEVPEFLRKIFCAEFCCH